MKVWDEGYYEIISRYQDTEIKIIEVVQEITDEKAPDAPEEVKTGDNTKVSVSVIIGIFDTVQNYQDKR